MSDDPGDAPHVDLGVAAVARRLGVAAGTLRTWDRRYGVGPTGHVAGSHRRYTVEDVARLTLMRRLMLDGAAPAEAAVVALRTDGESRPAHGWVADPDGAGHRTASRRRAGGGRVIPLRDASPAARGLARAAMALDTASCTSIIRSSLGRRGVMVTWQELCLPVLAGAGERWRATGRGVEVEHLLAECMEDGLREVTRRLAKPLNLRAVLVAALESEEHRLPLHALSAALAERLVAVRMLGPRLPVRALADALTRTGAGAAFVWGQASVSAATVAGVDDLPVTRPACVVLLGGPGWRAVPLPAGARWVPDLPSAVESVCAAVGVGAAGGAGPR